jgi:ribosomal protein L30/L7E
MNLSFGIPRLRGSGRLKAELQTTAQPRVRGPWSQRAILKSLRLPMKHDAAVLEAGPALIFFSPRKTAILRRLRITRWRTHSWIKRIIKVRTHSDTREKTPARRQRGRQAPPR